MWENVVYCSPDPQGPPLHYIIYDRWSFVAVGRIYPAVIRTTAQFLNISSAANGNIGEHLSSSASATNSRLTLLIPVPPPEGHSRTWRGRWTWTTARWGTRPSTTTSWTREPTRWSRTAPTPSCGGPSAGTTAWTTVCPAPLRGYARWDVCVCE